MSAATATTRTAEDTRRWMEEGTALWQRALASRGDAELEGGTALAGWTGRHLLAHVAANAEALGHLVTWAATGVETPMYSSPEQRDADIAAGAARPVAELREWDRRAAAELADAVDALTPEQLDRPVRTAQGRTVPAREVTWMRSREVMVHAVDLGGSVTFADLPADLLAALVADVATRRSTGDGPALHLTATDAAPGAATDGSPDAGHGVAVAGTGEPVAVSGPLDDLARWLTGRGEGDLTTTDGGALPALPPWL